MSTQELGKHFDANSFALWLDGIERAEGLEELSRLFLGEAMRFLSTDLTIYMRYSESQKVLAVQDSLGAKSPDLVGVGIDLVTDEPGFEEKMLKRPRAMHSLRDFVKKGLGYDQAIILPLEYKNKIRGVFVLPLPRELSMLISSEAAAAATSAQSAYLQVCVRSLVTQLSLIESRAWVARNSRYDTESGVYTVEAVKDKLSEEVSRSRRISRPTSTLVLSVDNYYDLMLEHSSSTMSLLVQSIAEILKTNSRVNDFVGRLSANEFAVCLAHTGHRGAMTKAERLRRLIRTADFSEILGAQRRVTVSVGVAEYPTICTDAEDLLRLAHSAHDEARKTGGDGVRIATTSMKFIPDFKAEDENGLPTHSG